MTEIKDAPLSADKKEEKVAGNIVSRGKSEPVTFTQPGEKADENNNGADNGAANETAEEKTAREEKELLLKNENAEQKTARELAEKNKPPELTDDQLKELLKGKGIELDDKGFEGLKQKLQPPAAAPPEPTPEEKAKAESELEKRMLNRFLAAGGTIEAFAGMKKIISSDLKELSQFEITKELKEAKDAKGERLFSDDEIAIVLKERYYQIKLEEIEQGENETTEEFEKRKALIEKKIAFGSKKLESKSAYIKKQAEDAMSIWKNAIKEEDDEKQEEIKNSQRVEDFFKKLPRKVTIELGETKDGQKLTPIEYDIPETVIAEVTDVLKTSEKRNKFLYNEDNSLNLDNLAGVMLRNKYLEGLVKDAYIQGDDSGSNREVAKFEKIFPGRTAKEIGVGGEKGSGGQGRKGVLVSRGEPEVVKR